MGKLDPQWVERQYNNRALVPEHPEILARWRAASALAREGLVSRLDLAYGPKPSQRLDVFAAEQGGGPVLVFIHGGYWRSLDKADHSFVAPALVAAGANVVVPNYSLCPGASIAEIALEMTRAVAWVHAEAAAQGFDASRVVLAGHSAGAHLAAMLLCCRWPEVDAALPAAAVQGALGISGLYDLAPLCHAPFLAADLRLTSAEARRLSPAGFAPPRQPLYAVVGGDESDEFVRQNLLIHEQWGADAVPVCETLVGLNHFTVLRGLADPRGRLLDLSLRLLGLR